MLKLREDYSNCLIKPNIPIVFLSNIPPLIKAFFSVLGLRTHIDWLFLVFWKKIQNKECTAPMNLTIENLKMKELSKSFDRRNNWTYSWNSHNHIIISANKNAIFLTRIRVISINVYCCILRLKHFTIKRTICTLKRKLTNKSRFVPAFYKNAIVLISLRISLAGHGTHLNAPQVLHSLVCPRILGFGYHKQVP